jgi:hypothetical protein
MNPNTCDTSRYVTVTFTCDGENDSAFESSEGAAASTRSAFIVDAINPTITSQSVTSHFTHTDLESVGDVSFNLHLLNAIQRMTRYTSLSNLMDHPTDCPTRERAGWTGDGQLTSPVRYPCAVRRQRLVLVYSVIERSTLFYVALLTSPIRLPNAFWKQ